IGGRGVCGVLLKGGPGAPWHQDRGSFLGGGGGFLPRRRLVGGGGEGAVGRQRSFVFGAGKKQTPERGGILWGWGGGGVPPLLLHTPRSPVEDKELRSHCLHNH